ncbi:MAG: hypothetical protein BWY59_01745 [Verrucomicrobia bacterium ADurb.Bin345]|nr:MAG: hypothetical protein BWY59_01745 [Verrucomicrobia bacterium ADurb.Bin345]
MSRRLSIAWYIRVAILMAAFLAAWVLYLWNLRQDPRFYRFVGTRSGRTLARVFSWHESRPPVPFSEKSEQQMTADELAVKRRLEEEIAGERPTHRLELKDGNEWIGRLLEETAAHVVFSETYGESGGVSVSVPRSQIRSIRVLDTKPPAVSYRDVRFRMEFPALRFYKRAPYSILTDESYFRVEATVNELVRLYREFIVVFGDLVTVTNRMDDIQLLFFSQAESYRAYQEQYAPHMPNSTGFYNPWVDRLVVFNQVTAPHVSRARDWVAREEARYREQYAGQPRAQEQIGDWRRRTDAEIARFAEVQTLNTIRHEGAHQLFFSLGVHSAHRIENEWVFEGLAVYCETGRPGEKDAGRVRALREAEAAGRLIPLADLVDLRSPLGLGAVGDPARVDLAYAQAWSLVHFLMQDAYRESFFRYLRQVRDPRNFESVRRTRAMRMLTRALGVSPARLEELWREHVRAL